MKLPIYLDNNATTPVAPEVLEAMLPYFTEKFGNASSKTHGFGHEAAKAVETARKSCAKLIGAEREDEIIFTSGATEAINIAIKGIARANVAKGKHIISCKTEHKAVLDSLKKLEEEGFEVKYLNVNREGLISLDDLKKNIRADTILVSIMVANNEIGTIQPIKEIGNICKKAGVLFFNDATQAVGKIPLDVKEMNIDSLSISAHKIYGPKGVGALYLKRKKPLINIYPILSGGGHEKGIRPGTLNVPGVVGLGAAVAICLSNMRKDYDKTMLCRRRIINVLAKVEGIYINGSQENMNPGTLNITIKNVNNEALMVALKKEIAISTGSACTSVKIEPSHVLSAIGYDEKDIQSTIRIGLGRNNTIEEAEYSACMLAREITRLRGLNSDMRSSINVN
jgi:cysteine desulfurase